MLYGAVVPQDTHPDEVGANRADTVRRFFAAIQAGDYPALQDLLTPDAVTRWPQSGETITSAMACVRVYESYPGGPPTYDVDRVVGAGNVWVAELSATYGEERWYVISVCEFEGDRIARLTEYFGQALPAPAWRRDLVDPIDYPSATPSRSSPALADGQSSPAAASASR